MARNDAAEETTAPSDYERIGGGRAVAQVVDLFYERILGDPALAPFFVGVDMARLKRHQALLISQVLGGPAEYEGRDLGRAHAGLRISSADFGRVAAHLVSTLQDAAVDDDVIARVAEVLGGTEKDIVTAEAY